MTLKSRAIAFAFCTGAVAFVLALFAGAFSGMQAGDLSGAIILAIMCGVMSWVSAKRAITGYAEAVEVSIARLASAAEGDLLTPTPDSVATILPELAHSLDGLLAQVRTSLDSAQALALFDSVTQLPNRAHFRSEVTTALKAMPAGALAGLFFIDLDKFKAVNDNFGHAQGDQLLIQVAERLRELARIEDSRCPGQALVGRLAGDEFTVLVPALASRDQAERIGDAILDALSEPYTLAGRKVEISASIGVALWPDQGGTLTELMRAADLAMYQAKESGRGHCQLFTPSLAARLADNVRLEGELRAALDRREFTFVFQPQIATMTGAPIAAEALLRWRHPSLGLIAPHSFLAQAEQNGLIHEIGYWAVEEIAEIAGRWERQGLSTRITAAISPRQIARPDFFAQVRHAMARHRTSGDLIELEITESVAMQCDDAALAGLARLREQGATVAVDDFGTGYSNLARLKDLPLDRVKIDRTLVAGLASCERSRTLVQALIGLVHGLGLEVVAEGVESAAQRALLEVAGCDALQGRAIARPMAEADLHRWLDQAMEQRVRA